MGNPDPGSPVSVLIVEDNPADVWLIQESLRQSGMPHHTKVIDDGEEALRFLEECSAGEPSPDVVVLDLNLPRVDGTAILQSIRGDGRLSGIPVAILSSSKAPADMAVAKNVTNVIYIVKPSDLDTFLEVGEQIYEFWRRCCASGSPPGPD